MFHIIYTFLLSPIIKVDLGNAFQTDIFINKNAKAKLKIKPSVEAVRTLLSIKTLYMNS